MYGSFAVRGELRKVLTWKRIAAGLVPAARVENSRNEDIYITCRDQIVRLRDLNSDGESDFYENFNGDHQVTEHFHEFAMGLQTDAEGKFLLCQNLRAMPSRPSCRIMELY